jgi:2-polyprenyl-3-methyl-5-hydroxy-6-metoxy-1,4-benzoquinol methylase
VSSEINKTAFQPETNDPEDIHVWLCDESPASLLEFERYMQWISLDDVVMDIGSGAGSFLEVLRRKGIKAFGVDLNESLAKRASARGSTILVKDVLRALTEDTSGVTVFSMMDFVEHIPLRTFLEILRTLSAVPGAKVLIQTPNLESVIGMKFWFHLPSHVTPLHPFFLRRILKKYGFEIVDEWTAYGNLPWSGFRRWFTLKLLNGVFGPPVAKMLCEGANIAIVAIAPGRLS